MKFIRKEVLAGELSVGTWLNLGSSLTAEMAGLAGLDWALIDLEHGSGGETQLLHQLQALAGTSAAPMVRIAWNEAPRFKRVLDMGASGVMVPYVNNAREAELAVAAMRYPPQGVRGVAKGPRAAGFGPDFDQYFPVANDNVLTIVQVETAEAVEHAEAIASVEGVDVLFIGPLDLSASLGVPKQFDHPSFRDALKRVAEAARKAGKAGGALLAASDQIEQTVRDGFSFVAVGSDGGLVANGMRRLAGDVDAIKRKMRSDG